MQPADAPSSFLRVDEFNENSGPESRTESQEPNVDDDRTWDSAVPGLNDDAPPPTIDPADTGQPAESRSPGRPALQRDQWGPTPEHPPPPVPSENAIDDTDVSNHSLSMVQLRRMIPELHKKEVTPYAFEYEDTSGFEEELEEWFDYSVEDRAHFFDAASSAFEKVWHEWQTNKENAGTAGSASWGDSSEAQKTSFLRQLHEDMSKTKDPTADPTIVLALAYLAMGVWKETALRHTEDDSESPAYEQATEEDRRFAKSKRQVMEIKSNMILISQHVGVDLISQATRFACDECFAEDAKVSPLSIDSTSSKSLNATHCVPRGALLLMYLFMDLAKRETPDSRHADLVYQCHQISGATLDYFTGILATLRWNESSALPLQKALAVYWKTIVVAFGNTHDAKEITKALNQGLESQDESTTGLITASPLDYHLFRQEITSKYPAFEPAKPLFPFDADTTSMVPPPKEHSRMGTHGDSFGPANINGGGSSILHQPVHIATPAPSPPPSPAGPGGKGIKKQNYQTNQLFPFLYPPLDGTSNEIGGKGGPELQDLLVGRKWEGSDVPASILEAADIFASRMRASRAMKQLWDERVRFIKYERGYLNTSDSTDTVTDDGIVEHEGKDDFTGDTHIKSKQGSRKLDERSKQRLAAVEGFYSSQVSNLPSVVIVLLKVLLQTVTTLVTQPSADLQPGFESPEQASQDKSHPNGASSTDDMGKPIGGRDEYINTMRGQEIMGKSVSGILLLLLKWFKLSHVLKFEYLTQLLFDSNYVQLILKLFTHQELELAVNFKCDLEKYNFFAWCRHIANPDSSSPLPTSATEPSDANADDAVPPPIPRAQTVQPIEPQAQPYDPSDPPLTTAPLEFDELGYPTSSPPHAPITNYSWRTFFTSINHLRILQKIVKSKPHRQLLMVQYKYSNILKKSLKVPQPDVRLYTLKIIKGQVPYCHRKWRQSNMRIITAIYLDCKPELRDDWLAGLTMEEEMSEALPQEQALRSLTYWHNLTKYPASMTDDPEKAKGLLEEEQDFFVKELEAMDAMAGDRESSVEGEIDPLDSAADPGRWNAEERDNFLARLPPDERVGMW